MKRDDDLAEALRQSFGLLNRALKIEAVRDPKHPYARFNVSDLLAFDFIGRNPGCIMRDVAKELSSPMSTVTSVVDRLVKAGIVARESSAKDRRIVRLVVTKKGMKLGGELNDAQRRSCEIALKALKPAERAVFVALLDKAAQALAADAFKS